MTVLTENQPYTTRFAPSPTGYLHLGHAFSALVAETEAKRTGGRFLLRIEDIDTGRCRPAFEDAIYEDLHWLGLTWEMPVRRQSDHMADYTDALQSLDKQQVLFPCFCTRKELQEEVQNAGQAPHSFDGPHYPGTCKHLSVRERRTRIAHGETYALRLDLERAIAANGTLDFFDLDRGAIDVDFMQCDDVVLARKDIGTSYHLSVVVDDALQGVNLVTRGEDLLPATHIHRVLQNLLNLPAPRYRHHKLLKNNEGKRFAKRNKSLTLAALRQGGRSPADIRQMIGLGAKPT